MTREQDHFEFRDHTADLQIRLEAGDLPGLLIQAGLGLYAAVGQLAPGSQSVEDRIQIQADDAETLLHDWMAELLFRLETRRRWYRAFTFHDCRTDCVDATGSGVIVDFENSQLDREVKAVTLHDLEIVRAGDVLRADIVLDI